MRPVKFSFIINGESAGFFIQSKYIMGIFFRLEDSIHSAIKQIFCAIKQIYFIDVFRHYELFCFSALRMVAMVAKEFVFPVGIPIAGNHSFKNHFASGNYKFVRGVVLSNLLIIVAGISIAGGIIRT